MSVLGGHSGLHIPHRFGVVENNEYRADNQTMVQCLCRSFTFLSSIFKYFGHNTVKKMNNPNTGVILLHYITLKW